MAEDFSLLNLNFKYYKQFNFKIKLKSWSLIFSSCISSRGKNF